MSVLARMLEDHRLWRESAGTAGSQADLRVTAKSGTFHTEDFRPVTFELPGPRRGSALMAEIRQTGLAGADLSEALMEQAVLAGIDLRAVVLKGAKARNAVFDGSLLDGADLSGADLASASFVGASLRGCRFEGADLTSAKFSSCDLSGSHWSGAKAEQADLSNAHLEEAVCRNVLFRRANLAGATLTGADLSEASLESADLAQATLDRASLAGANLRSAILTGVSLHHAVLDRADLRSSSLRHARAHQLHAIRADFALADLRNTDFTGANLQSASLTGANLEAAIFAGTRLTFADFRETTVIRRDAEGLETSTPQRTTLSSVHWDRADLTWARFDSSSLEQLPPAMLQTFRMRLNIQGAEASSVKVFISHAHEDAHHANEIYERLKEAGFQPWLDKRDLLPGEDWGREIPRQIRASDAVIVCLSTTAVDKRGYVQDEFKLAREELRRMPSDRIFIIPVRLDDCRVPEDFQAFQYVDYADPEAMNRILATLYRLK